jgi:hypothetical protein
MFGDYFWFNQFTVARDFAIEKAPSHLRNKIGLPEPVRAAR